ANAADNYLQTSMTFPPTWTAVKITYRWANNGAGAGNVVWSYQIASLAAGANCTTAPGDHPTTIAAGAQNILVDTVMAAQQPLVANTLNEFRVLRKGSSGSDTLANA